MTSQLARSEAEMIECWLNAIDAWSAHASGSTSSITGGGAIRALEGAFSDMLSGRPTVSVGSGTAALAACLLGCGARPGQDVVTSVLDWPAAAQAVSWIGCRPVFADVDPLTLTLSPAAVRAALTPRTSVVIATHLLGIPADVPAIMDACRGRALVVEDCAQSAGATLDGRPTGSLGDAAAFSFGPGKDIDAGEGGLSSFANHRHWQKALNATQHHVRALATRLDEPAMRLPTRIHPMAAVLALQQMDSLQARLAGRRARVEAWLAQHPEISAPGRDPRRAPSWWQVAVRGSSGSRLSLRLPPNACPSRFPVAAEALHSIRLVEPAIDATPSPAGV